MRLRKSPGARNTRVRAKITAMLLSLVALWGFAAWVTVRDGWNLLEAGQIDETAGRPTKSLINMLQDERRLSLVQLGRPRGAVVPGLADQRERTDRLVTSWRRSAKDAPGKITKNVADTRKRLDALDAVRASIDAGTADRSSAAQVYNQAIDAAFGILVINAQLDDQEVAADGRALIALTRGRELLAREDAFLSGVIAEGRFGPGDLNRFAQAVGVQRYGLEEAYAQLAPGDRKHYEEVTRGAAYSAVRSMEDRILAQRPRALQRPGVTATQWQAASKPLLNQLDQAIDKGGDAVVERAEPVGYGVLLRLVLVAGLGLVAVVASIVLAFTTARAIIRQLNRLRIAAEELADTRLPDVVARLGRGEKVDVAAQAPPLRFGDDEIGRVGKAFNRVQETAIAAAVQQAEQRAGFRKTLRNLAQRNQSLVNRQLQMIDRMERREDLAGKELEDLLRLDHLTTRARRNAENLVQLSGGQPTRVWRRPVPILDVIRAAVSEVENYERATFQRIDPAWLRGHAVIDVIRLLAELIENALSFSSPETTVEISGQTTPNGFAIAVEDKGLGLDPDRLEVANHMLATPPEFDVAPEERLGLLVAGLIARRHSITTTLKRSPYGASRRSCCCPTRCSSVLPRSARSSARAW
ncbi:nitrate- and nitrite sensing domain-containing protein [Actinomadura yumaensis]|uniref:sensor histidine kinase n=1 Tax=Actinomadura yumaensis TaxID=111807 RepID=UPI003623BDF4